MENEKKDNPGRGRSLNPEVWKERARLEPDRRHTHSAYLTARVMNKLVQKAVKNKTSVNFEMERFIKIGLGV